MSDDEKTVGIHADEGTESIGKSAYVAARDGQYDQKAYRSSLIIAFGFMAPLFIVTWITSKKAKESRNGEPIPTPSISRDGPALNPKLFTDRDLTNVIRSHTETKSALGRIRVVSLRSLSEIPVGAEVKAVLESGATDGIVKAKLTEPLLVDGEPLLPQSAILFGKGKSGEDRLTVEFKKIIFPSGESFPIRAQAFDISDKILGLKGAIVGTRTKKMAGAMAFGFLGGMADGLQDTSGSSLLFARRPSVRDGALAGASKAALDQSQLYLEELRKSPNIIQVKAGESIVVIFDDKAPSERERE